MSEHSTGPDPYAPPPAPTGRPGDGDPAQGPGTPSAPDGRDDTRVVPREPQPPAPEAGRPAGPSPVPTWYADAPAERAPGGWGSGQVTQVQERPQPAAPPPSPWGDGSSDRPGSGYPQGPAPRPAQGPGQAPVGWTEAAPWGAAPAVDTLGRPDRGRRGGGGLVALAVVLALVAGLLGGVLGSLVADGTDLAQRVGLEEGSSGSGGTGDGSAAPDTGGSTGVADQPVGETGSVAEIAARVLPSVVSIRVTADAGQGTGSGFVIDDEGLIVTNNHVVAAGGTEPADDIVVELSDGSQAEAEVVGTEPSYDIAVIRIDPADVGAPLVELPFGDSDRVVVGEQVVAIGAPLGLDSTVTTGIVSALNRPVSAGDAQQTAFINAIQTDAAINPGNSGGPLVNMRGEVVGVNSAIAQAPGGQTGGSIGLGFSIPSNQAQRTATELIETGVATFPVVGVLLDRSYTGEGVRIVSEEDSDTPPITPGGPGEAAGLQAGRHHPRLRGAPGHGVRRARRRHPCAGARRHRDAHRPPRRGGLRRRRHAGGGRPGLSGPVTLSAGGGPVFDINGGEFVVLALLAALLLGPDRLPELARGAARLIRRGRDFATGASAQMRDEMGVDLDAVDWRRYDPRQYHPRRIVQNALSDAFDDDPPASRRKGATAASKRAEAARSGARTSSAPAAGASSGEARPASGTTAARSGPGSAAAQTARTPASGVARRPSPPPTTWADAARRAGVDTDAT